MRHPRPFRHVLPLALVPLALLGCTADAPDRTGEEPAMAAIPVAGFDLAAFDSVVWHTPREALDRGATVYAYSCRKCHGDSGAGDGGYQLQGRALRPPSFLEANWSLANDPAGLRQAIYEGSERGMHHAGMTQVPVKDVDAVARYITRLWEEAG